MKCKYVELINEYLKPQKVADISIIKKNLEVDTYLITSNQTKKYYLKIIHSEDAKKRKQREVEMCRKIRKIIPEFPCVIPNKLIEVDNVSIYIEDGFKGTMVGDHLSNNKAVEEAYRQLASYLLQMHSIEVDSEWSDIFVLEQYNWYSYVKSSYFNYLQTIEEKKLLDISLIFGLKRYWQKNEYALYQVKRLSLIHNDLAKENIIVDIDDGSGCLTGIIDFERSIIGDPIKEISKMVWVFKEKPTVAKAFLSEYFKDTCDKEEINIRIQLYYLWDILNHIRQQEELLQYDNWKKYIEEEKEILSNLIIKEEKICL